MREVADRVLDDSFSTALDGASLDYEESSSSLAFAFVLALVLIYLVLSAQFESFRDPLIIMFTVPLALAGSLLSLWYFGQTINIFSQIGQIMLIGLVTKNGILIVEFANQRKAQGLTVLRGDSRCGRGPVSPDSHDGTLHDPGDPPDRSRPGRGLGEPDFHGDCDHRWTRAGDGANAVRYSRGVFVHLKRRRRSLRHDHRVRYPGVPGRGISKSGYAERD